MSEKIIFKKNEEIIVSVSDVREDIKRIDDWMQALRVKKEEILTQLESVKQVSQKQFDQVEEFNLRAVTSQEF